VAPYIGQKVCTSGATTGASPSRLALVSDPVQEFGQALERLAALERDVAAGARYDEVSEAVRQLRLAVLRAYSSRPHRQGRGQGARARILEYLAAHIGEWVSGEELSAVSGIQEWARRVRELRVEDGYDIEESNGRYRMRSRDPDTLRRLRWRTVTKVKEGESTPERKVATLLESLQGIPVLVDELNRVAGTKDGTRLARQLRTDHQWPIETDADNSSLTAGEYRLVTASPYHRLPGGQELFSEDVRRALYRRDGHRCWTCGGVAGRTESVPANPFFLVVRHLDASGNALQKLPASVLNDLSRLATSCNRCATSGA